MIKQKASDQSSFKKKSNQASEEFRQQETTIDKIKRNLNTTEQQKLDHTTSMVNGSFEKQNSSKKQNRLRNQSNQNSKEFRQQENTATKIERNLNTTEQQKSNHTSNIVNDSLEKHNFGKKTNQQVTQKSEKFYKHDRKNEQSPKNEQNSKEKSSKEQNSKEQPKTNKQLRKQKYKLQMQKINHLGKEAVGSGIAKYQEELEKDDEGVRLASKSLTKTYKQSTKSLNKLKKRQFYKRISKKSKNPLFKEKPKKSSLKKIARLPSEALKKGGYRYQKELEKDDEGVKLVSESASKIAKSSKNLYKISKIDSQSKKLNKHKNKSMKLSNKNKKLQVQSKNVLKKKKMKKRLYSQNKSKRVLSKETYMPVLNRITSYFKNSAFKVKQVAKILISKYIAVFGGGLASLIPIFLVAIICLVVAGALGVGSYNTQEDNMSIGVNKNLSPNVERWRGLVEQEAKAEGMESYVSLILAIIQVETGGTGTKDIMQSSESAGHPPNYWTTEEESIRQGIKHLKSIVNILKGFNKGYESNTRLIAQAYNFGSAFASYVGRQGGQYTLDIAEKYSKEVVAPANGNYNGTTVAYLNDTSIKLGKTYRYLNGGNFLYGELVAEYIGGGAGITGDFKIVLNEVEKYKGWPYVWGGKNPSTGFDCSGLTSWGLKQIGINLPSYAQSQYNLTTPVSEAEAQPGDLIFFKGTYGGSNHISHVAFYIDENTMYDSNGSGVGYHNWKDSYWQQHFAGIRRIK